MKMLGLFLIMNITIMKNDLLFLGISYNLRILVIHAYREDDEIIRIISARKASKSEIKYYYEMK